MSQAARTDVTPSERPQAAMTDVTPNERSQAAKIDVTPSERPHTAKTGVMPSDLSDSKDRSNGQQDAPAKIDNSLSKMSLTAKTVKTEDVMLSKMGCHGIITIDEMSRPARRRDV